MKEIWKDVVGYEGRYKVSNYGNVKSVIFNHKGKEKNLTLLNGKDYLLVRLYKNGKGKMQRVHRLVAEAFIENPQNYPVVNHKNWNKRDNRVENLEWCSYSYNNWYIPNRNKPYFRTSEKQKSQHFSGKPFASPKRVLCVETGEIFESISKAAQFTNVEQSNVSRALRGRQRTSGGYHWKYVDEDTRNVGTLELADGAISPWYEAKMVDAKRYETCVFDLSDLRKLKGRFKIVVERENQNLKISMVATN